MSTHVRVRVSGAAVADGAADEVLVADESRSLLRWLADADELRGQIMAVEKPPRPGTLGPLIETIGVVLGSSGMATALTTGVIAWVRSRRSDITVKLTRPDGSSFELTGKRVKLLTDEKLKNLADTAARMLESNDGDDGSGPTDGTSG
ncbi:hypothetical protein OK074_4282 [Actinobacteria bacterium OK074]|nr:hypothetical protein OK074_4282 [Actinobacteria bacterium OK074]